MGSAAPIPRNLDLTEYETIAFAEVDYSIFTLRQASKRSWRVGQTRPVEVVFFAYRDTMQATALSLVARKLRGALQLEGDTFDLGLAAADQPDDSLLTMLARALRSGEQLDDVERLFADARQAEALQSQEIVAWPPLVAEPMMRANDAAETRPTTALLPATRAPIGQRLVLGDRAALARATTRSAPHPSRTAPAAGQLSFVELIDAPPSTTMVANQPPTEEDTASAERQLTLL